MTFLVFSVLPAPDSPLITWLATFDWSGIACLRYEDALVFSLFDEVVESLVSHGKYMRSSIFATLSLVHLDVFIRVDRDGAVRIDRDEEKPGVGLQIS